MLFQWGLANGKFPVKPLSAAPSRACHSLSGNVENYVIIQCGEFIQIGFSRVKTIDRNSIRKFVTFNIELLLTLEVLRDLDSNMEQISYKREIFYSHSLTAKENLKKWFIPTLLSALCLLWPLLLTWFNFNPSMDKQLHIQQRMGWNYLSIPKLQRCNRWSLRIDK